MLTNKKYYKMNLSKYELNGLYGILINICGSSATNQLSQYVFNSHFKLVSITKSACNMRDACLITWKE